MKIRFSLLAGAVSLGIAQGALAQTGPSPVLRAGAARIDVSPPEGALPEGFDGILDRVYVRAIALESGGNSAALITLDAGGIPEDLWQSVSRELELQLHIPASNVMLTATHTHSSPPPSGHAVAEITRSIVDAVKSARTKLQPARIGYGTGVSYINVNRNLIDPKTRRWWEGPNYDGPSDKTVAVITFQTLAGDPIAVYYNYAMHAVAVGQLDLISGDAPGATSRYIEDSFNDGIVALWSEGAAGDQNPLYYQQTYDLRDIRIRDYAKRGVDISNAMPRGGEGLNRQDPRVAKLMSQQKQMILSMGQFLGEEVMHVMRGQKGTDSSIRIYGAQKTVSCPGRERTDSGRAGYPGIYRDAGPVDLRLSLLMLGDVAIGGVNGEVFNLIAQRLKKESGFAHTMLATLTNGTARSGYIPNDAAFGFNTFEVVSSKLKPGCAEDAIVNGLLDLMPAVRFQVR